MGRLFTRAMTTSVSLWLAQAQGTALYWYMRIVVIPGLFHFFPFFRFLFLFFLLMLHYVRSTEVIAVCTTTLYYITHYLVLLRRAQIVVSIWFTRLFLAGSYERGQIIKLDFLNARFE